MTVPFVQAAALGVKAITGTAAAVMEYKDFQKQLEQERKNLRREQQSLVELAGERAQERARQLNEHIGEVAAVAGFGNVSGTSVMAAAGELAVQTGRNDEQDFRALGDTLRTIRERRIGLDKAEQRAKINTIIRGVSLGLDTGFQATRLGGAANATNVVDQQTAAAGVK